MIDHLVNPYTITLASTLILFLIGREVWCWYWKINKATQLLEDILRELKESNRK